MDLPPEDEDGVHHQVVGAHLDDQLIFSEEQLAESLGDPHHHHHHDLVGGGDVEEDEGMILPDIQVTPEGHVVVEGDSLMDTTDEGEGQMLETIVEEDGSVNEEALVGAEIVCGDEGEEGHQMQMEGMDPPPLQESSQVQEVEGLKEGNNRLEGEQQEVQQVQEEPEPEVMEEEEPPCDCPTCQENSDENGVFKGIDPAKAKCIICYVTLFAPEHVRKRPEPPPPPEQEQEGGQEQQTTEQEQGEQGEVGPCGETQLQLSDAETQRILPDLEGEDEETQVISEQLTQQEQEQETEESVKLQSIKLEAKQEPVGQTISEQENTEMQLHQDGGHQQILEILGEKSGIEQHCTAEGDSESQEAALKLDLLFHVLNSSFDDLDQEVDLLINNNYVPLCENCHAGISNALSIYREIQRLEASLGNLRDSIKDQVSKSFDANFCKRKKEEQEIDGLLGQIDATRRAILGEDCPAIARLLNYKKKGKRGRKPGRKKAVVSRSALYPQVTLESGNKKRGRPKKGGVKQEYNSEQEYDEFDDDDDEEEHEVIQTHSGRRVKKPNYKKWLLGDDDDDEKEETVKAEKVEDEEPMSPADEPDWSPGQSDEEFQEGAETDSSSEDSDLGNSDDENEYDDDGEYSDGSPRKRRRSSANRIPCEGCDKTFADEDKKARHFQRYHEPGGEGNKRRILKVHSCDHCDKEFKRPNLLKRHLEKDHGIVSENGEHSDKKKHVCEFCGQKYRNGSELRVHVRLHTGETPFNCDHCDQSFVSALKRETHIEQCHWEVPPLKCEFCDRAFFRQHRLRIHRITHTGERAYLCEICSQAFSHPTYLKYHQGQHAELNMESYKCKECGKQFANPTNLKLHVKTVHLKEFRFSCEVCGMGFTHMSHKRIHMRGHTGERPYKCEICGEAFRYKDRLRIHLRGHTGERPFVCDVCKKGFASRSKLKRHEKIHEKTMGKQEEEPQRPLRYVCDDCGKAFAEPQHLSAHKRYCQRRNMAEKDEKPKATKSAPGKIKAVAIPAVTVATVPVTAGTVVTAVVQQAAAATTTSNVQKIQIEHIPTHTIQTQQAQMLVPVTYTYPVAYGYEVTTQQYQPQTQQQQQQQTSNVREYTEYN